MRFGSKLVGTMAAVAALAISGTACSEVESVVDEATSQVEDVVQTARYCLHALEVADAVAARDVDAAVAAGEQLVDVAPDDILAEARTVLEAARRARDGDPSALQSDEVQRAAERLRTYTEDTCNPTN